MFELCSQSVVYSLFGGAVAGALSMQIYRRLSPQSKLQDLKLQITALQQIISDYDGDFAGAMTLTQQNLLLSFRRLGYVLGPSFLSGIPVLVALPLIGDQYVAYFMSVAVVALTCKHRLQIA